MPDFIVREATPDDAPQIIDHVVRISNEPNNNILMSPGEFTMTIEEEAALLAEYAAADNAVYLIAEADGKIIGSLNCRGGKRSANRHNAALGIVVNKDWRDRGVGTALMERVIDWARASGVVTRLELEVFTDNGRAVHVYEKVGFQIEGRKVRAYFKEGVYVDAYVMALLL
jgi:RimJ/RimL family protein N-acetyltransferase